MTETWSKWAPMPLRLILGFGFLYHGVPKLFTAQGHEMFVGMLQNIGVPAAGLAAWLVGIVEVLGALALIAGAFVTIASVLLIINMLVALFTVHLPNGFSFIHVTGMTDAGPQFGMPGYEVNLLYIAGLLALLLRGPTHMSVDQRLAEKARGGGSSM
ncbi:MAG: DoxX family protein [Gemmatimonadetes bacterium]|nr:DoxX family protein [Gemmatimonadota bacterium]